MNFKQTKLYGILNDKCPRCLTTNLFIDKNPYHLKNITQMHQKCAACGCNFEKETWFFYGAMYASYGLNVAWGMLLFGLYYLFFWQMPLHYFVILLSLSIVFLFPIILRKSRVLWLNLFEKYDKDAIHNYNSLKQKL
jgi:phage FluMu protein Com